MQMISKATIIMSQEGHKKDKFHLKLRNAEDIIGSQNQVLSGISSSPPSGDERNMSFGGFAQLQGCMHMATELCQAPGLHKRTDRP